MASEVQICNEALSFLGVPAIIALTDDSKAARQCNLHYESKRDQLLRDFEWKFATERTNLAPTVDTPSFGWSYEFNLPADCLKLLYVGDSFGLRYSYSLEKNKILANYNIVYIKYTQRIVDPNEMDPLFRAALSMFIAQYIATPLGMKSEYNKIVEEYETRVSGARFAGSIEDDDEVMETTDWINSRF